MDQSQKPEVTHDAFIDEDFIGGVRSGCSCGWAGPERETVQQAQADIDEHYRQQHVQ